MLLPSALRRKAGAFLEDGIGKKYYQKQVEGGVLLHPRQASCGYLGCIPAVGSVTCCGPAPPPLPFGLCRVGTAQRFTISTELWINLALEEANVSRKSNSSTKINEQQR